MSDFLLYGMNEAGQPVFSELLRGQERAGLASLAQSRLREWAGVEIWEGPMCVVRLTRDRVTEAAPEDATPQPQAS